jgi:hypothetical protein
MLEFRKTLVVTFLGVMVAVSPPVFSESFTIIGKDNNNTAKTWYIKCENGATGSVNYSHDLNQYYANSKGIYPYYSSLQDAGSKECSGKSNYVPGPGSVNVDTNRDDIDLIESMKINYANLDYYSYNIEQCVLKITVTSDTAVTTKILDLSKVDVAKSGRDMNFTKAYPSGDLYAHSLVCKGGDKCAKESWTGQYAGKSDMDFTRTYSIINNTKKAKKINDTFMRVARSCQ